MPSQKVTELTVEEYMELTRVQAPKTVAKILKEFDFQKAQRALKGCGWKYEGATSSPSANELKKLAKKLLESAMQSGVRCTVGGGPLEAEAHCYDVPEVVTLTLKLSLFRKSDVYVDYRVIAVKKARRRINKAATPAEKEAREDQ